MECEVCWNSESFNRVQTTSMSRQLNKPNIVVFKALNVNEGVAELAHLYAGSERWKDSSYIVRDNKLTIPVCSVEPLKSLF